MWDIPNFNDHFNATFFYVELNRDEDEIYSKRLFYEFQIRKLSVLSVLSIFHSTVLIISLYFKCSSLLNFSRIFFFSVSVQFSKQNFLNFNYNESKLFEWRAQLLTTSGVESLKNCINDFHLTRFFFVVKMEIYGVKNWAGKLSLQTFLLFFDIIARCFNF